MGDARWASISKVMAQFIQVHAAEGPLIDETQIDRRIDEGHPDPQVFLDRLFTRHQQQLAAHSKVSDQHLFIVEFEPEVLSPPAHRFDGPPSKPAGEILRSRLMFSDGTWMEHRNRRDHLSDQVTVKTRAHHFYFGKFGHR